MTIEQFVPQEACRNCDGCCRFNSKDTVWAPQGEEIISYGDYAICSCFNPPIGRCKDYQRRPFDCRIYPFLIHRDKDTIYLAADLKCPYLNSTVDTDKFRDYAGFLLDLLNTDEGVELFKKNPTLAAEYDEELKIIGAIDLREDILARSIKIEDKALFDKYLLKSKHVLSVFSFANIFIWRPHFDISYKIINDNLCIFFKDKTGCFMYLPPLPDNIDRHVLEECFRIMDSLNLDHSLSRIENIEENNFDFYHGSGFKLCPKDKEYIYKTKDLINLSGDKFKTKRASYNYFVNNYNYKLESLSSDSIVECLDVLDSWKKERLMRNSANRSVSDQNDFYSAILEDNFLIQKEALFNFSKLDLVGKIVRIDGKVKAYSLGFELSKDIFCVLTEVADLAHKGIAQFIFREFARSLCKYEYINIMDDSGLENIRRVKLSYRPDRKLPAYILKRY